MTSNLTRRLTSTLNAESCKASVRIQLAELLKDGRDVLSVDAVAQWLDTANTKRPPLETSATTPTPRMDRQPAVDTTHQVQVTGGLDIIDLSVYQRGWCSGHTCTAGALSTSYTYEQRLRSYGTDRPPRDLSPRGSPTPWVIPRLNLE